MKRGWAGRRTGAPVFRGNHGRLQIRFTALVRPSDGEVERKAYFLSLGCDDTPANRHKCERVRLMIERDLEDGTPDLTLNKYRGVIELEPTTPKKSPFSLAELWQRYVTFKTAQGVTKTTLGKDYRRVEKLIAAMPFDAVDEATAIRDWLVANCSPTMAKRNMVQLSACADWAVISGLIPANSLKPLKATLKLPRGQRNTEDAPKAFTRNERDLILETFAKHKNYSHYHSYVWFQFHTGARPSEASALMWSDITSTHIVFQRVYVEGVDGYEFRDSLKTQKRRSFPINDQMREFLINLPRTHELVFPSPHGVAIRPCNFANRVWRSVVLVQLRGKVQPLTPYHMRHSFISMALERGVHPKDLAIWVGNSAEIILRNYASPNANLEAPEL